MDERWINLRNFLPVAAILSKEVRSSTPSADLSVFFGLPSWGWREKLTIFGRSILGLVFCSSWTMETVDAPRHMPSDFIAPHSCVILGVVESFDNYFLNIYHSIILSLTNEGRIKRIRSFLRSFCHLLEPLIPERVKTVKPCRQCFPGPNDLIRNARGLQ